VQLIPNSDRSGVLFRTSVKYEKSSTTLHDDPLAHVLHQDGQEVVGLRMGSVRQGEEGQQMPVVVNGGVVSFFYSYPSLYFWTTKLTVSACLGGLLATGGALPLVVEVDHCYYGVICVGHGAMLSSNCHFATDK
jgi:hypothetical protein